MRNDVRLYIGEQQVDWLTAPEILYNYTIDDVTNPTIVKNSFSKDITIEGTPNNNKIFGQFWSLERLQNFGFGNYSGSYFNPSQKVPFKIFVNGELYESGYIKLNNIIKKQGKIEYHITLFGGLGEFFYNLTYDDDGNKRTLASLDYMGTDTPDDEFTFDVNKDTVDEAWSEINSYNNKWSYINFAPCYNGVPDDFTPDKAVINWTGMPSPIAPTVVTEDDVQYTATNGYSLMDLGKERTEWEVRDLRSYLQRPVIRMRKVIEAICNPQNNGGYTVNLDNTFFTNENPYFEDTWMTLPLIPDLEFESKEELETLEVTLGTRQGDLYPVVVETEEPLYTANSLMMRFKVHTTVTGTSANYLYTNNYWRNRNMIFKSGWTKKLDYGAIFAQLVGYNAVGQVVAGSNVLCITSDSPTDHEVTYKSFEGLYTPAFETQYTTSRGKFKRTTGNTYVWANNSGQEQTFVLNITKSNAPIQTLKLRFTTVGRYFPFSTDTTAALYTALNTETKRADDNPDVVSFFTGVPDLQASSMEITNNGTLTNARINKKLLLNTQGTPADYLLSYCKLFGLYFHKDIEKKEISILTRGNYYKQDAEIIDIQDKIDFGQEMKIVPLVFDAKWYDWNLETVESVYANDYQVSTSVDYGLLRVNTGYDFDAENKDLYEGNSLKDCVEGLEKSQAFVKNVNGFPVGLLNGGAEYSLYKGNESKTFNMPYFDTTTVDGINTESKYMDLYSKAQMHGEDQKPSDGENVLLFYTGDITPGYNVNYWLTDDNAVMFALNNGDPCWIITNSTSGISVQNMAKKVVTMPHFERYRIDSVSSPKIIADSLDFGEPRQLYVPDTVTRPKSTIFYHYWQSYIEDMYDVNTRVLTCYVYVKGKVNPEWLRRFFWFDNSIWRINRIIDWDMASEKPTKMEFIKVQNKTNYDLTPVSRLGSITLTLHETTVPATGGTVYVDVEVSDGGSWSFECDPSLVSTPFDVGRGDTYNIPITILPNTGYTSRMVTIGARADKMSSAYVTQAGGASYVFEVTRTDDLGEVIPATGGTIIYTVISTRPWTATTLQSFNTRVDGNNYRIEVPALTDTDATREIKTYFRDGQEEIIKTENQIGETFAFDVQLEEQITNIPESGATIHYLVTASTDWQVYAVSSDVIVTPTSGTSGTARIEVVIPQNPRNSERIIALNFTDSKYHAINKTIPQDASTEYQLTINRFAGIGAVAATGGNAYFSVQSTYAWTATTDRNYFTLDVTSSTESYTTITGTFTANDSQSWRNAVITITDSEGHTATYTITQDGMQLYINLGVPSVYMTASQTLSNVSLSTNVSGIDITPHSGVTWYRGAIITQSQGVKYLGVMTEVNTGSTRTGTLTLSGSGVTTTLEITQEGANPGPGPTPGDYIILNPTTLSVSDTGTTTDVGLESNIFTENLSITNASGDTWYSGIVSQSGQTRSLRVTVNRNYGTTDRSGLITVSYSGISATVAITQAHSENPPVQDTIISYEYAGDTSFQLYSTNFDGPNIVTHTFADGIGTIMFDRPVARINHNNFFNSSSLSLKVYLPDSVVALGAICSSPNINVVYSTGTTLTYILEEYNQNRWHTHIIPATVTSAIYTSFSFSESNNDIYFQGTTPPTITGGYYFITNEFTRVHLRNDVDHSAWEALFPGSNWYIIYDV